MRSYPLPDVMGQPCQPSRGHWRGQGGSTRKKEQLQLQDTIAHVTKEVSRMAVQVREPDDAIMAKNNSIDPAPPITSLVTNTASGSAGKNKNSNNNRPMSTAAEKNKTTWKRQARENKEDLGRKDDMLTTQENLLGDQRKRMELDDEEDTSQMGAKRMMMQIPSLEDCLGKDFLQQLREEEKAAEETRTSNEETKKKEQGESQDKDGRNKEATGLGAACQLTSMKEHACQEQ